MTAVSRPLISANERTSAADHAGRQHTDGHRIGYVMSSHVLNEFDVYKDKSAQEKYAIGTTLTQIFKNASFPGASFIVL